MEFNANIFNLFEKNWALLSAGPKDAHNSMTISWGSLGSLWDKPTVTVYVKPNRFTHKFMTENDYFTVSFYPEEMHPALEKMGTTTGRHHTDKDAMAGLTVKDLGKVVTYEEAELTFVCRKIFFEDMISTHMPEEIVEKYYTPEGPHTLYIGEVVEIVKK